MLIHNAFWQIWIAIWNNFLQEGKGGARISYAQMAQKVDPPQAGPGGGGGEGELASSPDPPLHSPAAPNTNKKNIVKEQAVKSLQGQYQYHIKLIQVLKSLVGLNQDI